jgi:hypothetical protein
VLQIINNARLTGKEELYMGGKTMFLGALKDLEGIIEALLKFVGNVDWRI